MTGDADRIADAATGRTLLRLDARCPRCGSRPAIRATCDMLLALAHVDVGTTVGTYKCQRRACGHLYELTAAHFHRAS